MPKRQPKPAAPANAGPQLQNQLVTSIAEANQSPRARRRALYKPDIEHLKQHARFAKLEDEDLLCVLALVDLFTYSDHCSECTNDAPNWLGGFLYRVLIHVASEGPEEANTDPWHVKKEFDLAIETLGDALRLCREIQAKLPPSVLEQ